MAAYWSLLARLSKESYLHSSEQPPLRKSPSPKEYPVTRPPPYIHPYWEPLRGAGDTGGAAGRSSLLENPIYTCLLPIPPAPGKRLKVALLPSCTLLKPILSYLNLEPPPKPLPGVLPPKLLQGCYLEEVANSRCTPMGASHLQERHLCMLCRDHRYQSSQHRGEGD